MIDTTYSLYALLIANACLVAAAALAVLRFQRMMRECKSFWESPTGAALQTAAPAPAPARSATQDKMLAREIAVLQKTVASLCKQERSQLESTPDKMPLEHAVRMAKHGASIDDLTKKCGLNIGEARLMHRLHGRHSISAAA